jgi:GATA zinc finger
MQSDFHASLRGPDFHASLQSPDYDVKRASAPSAWELYSAVQEMYNSSSSLPQERPESSMSQVPPSPPTTKPFWRWLTQPPPHCTQCGTVQTRQWRRKQSGDIVCEQCGTEHLLNHNVYDNRPQTQNVRTPVSRLCGAKVRVLPRDIGRGSLPGWKRRVLIVLRYVF